MYRALICGTLLLAVVSIESTSIFQKTFKELHKEPPHPPAVSRADIITNWIEQPLDHFNENINQPWNMRYLSNGEFFKSGGPIFIFVGGEWSVSPGYIVGGHMYDMAKEHNGYLYYTEHRFYGESIPGNTYATDNLQYLTVQQSLNDLAYFIRTIKASNPDMANSKVILTGGSYSATMVTWFQVLFPDLAVGSWASSAPLLAKVDFFEYKEVTGQSIILLGGEECYNRIENGIAELENMFETKRSAEVKAMLQICNNFDENKELDIWTLFSEISDIFAGVVQTHSGQQIQNTCKTIMSGKDDVSGVASFLLKYFGGDECVDLSYKALVESLGDSKPKADAIMRQWIYQTCNEFGWYQTSASLQQPFGKKFPVDLYISACNDVFGDKFTNTSIYQKADDTNKLFGALKPNVKNVYYTHGQLDPWSAMGIKEEGGATIIPVHAHCKDFGSISSSDTDEMKASKEKIAALVREWLKDSDDTKMPLPVNNLVQKIFRKKFTSLN